MRLRESGLRRVDKLYSFLGITLIAVLFTLAYRKLWGAGMFAYGDCSPLPESAATAFKAFFAAWHPTKPGTNLGGPWLLIRGTFIFIFGNNAPLAQKVLHFSPLLLSFLSMFILLNRFVQSRFAKYVASFVYGVNPVSMGEFLGGGDYSVYVHALFPLLLIFLWRLLHDEKKIFNLLIFTLLLTLAYSCSDYVLIILLPFVIFFLVHSLFINRESPARLKKIISAPFIVLLPFIFCFLLLLPYTFSFLKTALPFLVGSRNLLPADVVMQLMADLKCCYGSWTLTQITRLGGSLYAPVFGIPVVLAHFGFIIPLLAFSSLFFICDRKKRKFIFGFICLSILTVIFIWLTHLKLILGLFRAFPFLCRFRNPARPILFLAFTYAPLIAITIDGVQRKLGMSFTRLFKDSWFRRPVAISIILSLIAVGGVSIYNCPFFSGDLSLKYNRGSNYEIPSNFYDIGKWLEVRRSSDGFFRTIWLPWVYEETEKKLVWIDPYTLSVVIGYEQYAHSPLTGYIELVFCSVVDESVQHWADLIALGNVRYIIVNLASGQKGPFVVGKGYFTPYLFGDPQKFANFLDKQKDLKLVVANDKYLIYENERFVPHVTAYQSISFVPSLPGQHNNPLETLAALVDVSGMDVKEQLIIFNSQLSARQIKLFSDELGELKKNCIVLPKYSLHYEFVGDCLEKSEREGDRKGVRIRSYKVSEAEYLVETESEGALFLVFGEAYHSSWNAYADGEILEHFPAFYWANGFYLNKTGKNIVKIVYVEQKIKNIMMCVSGLFWFFFLGNLSILLTKNIFMPYFRKRQRQE